MKRFGSLLLALVMCAALALPAFAEGDDNVPQTGTVTINNAVEKENYKIYQLLILDDDGGYAVNAAWGDYVRFADGKVSYLDTKDPEKWVEIKNSDAGSVRALLDLARSALINPTSTITVGDGASSASIELPYGYYLLDYDNGTGGLFYLDSAEKSINKKSNSGPSLVKKILIKDGDSDKEVDWTTVQLGDDVRFKVTVTLPTEKDWEEWEKVNGSYPCQIYDKVSSGLQLNHDVKVMVENELVIDSASDENKDKTQMSGQYGDEKADTVHLNYNDWDNSEYKKKSFAVRFGETYGADGSVGGTLEFLKRHPGATVTLIYSAKVIHFSEETPHEINTVHLTYGNKNEYDDAQVYDFTIVINKYDGETKKALTGAKFVLENENGEFYSSDKKPDGSNHAGNHVTWRKAQVNQATGDFTVWDEDSGKYISPTPEDIAAMVKVTDKCNLDGVNHFEGIPVGTYKLHEIEAPDGYARLREPITIVIRQASDERTENRPYTYDGLNSKDLSFKRVIFEAVIGGKEGEITSGNVPWDGGEWGGGGWDQLRLEVDVENEEETFHLPETGGIGTTIFYAVGGALLAGAVVLLAAKRRADGTD